MVDFCCAGHQGWPRRQDAKSYQIRSASASNINIINAGLMQEVQAHHLQQGSTLSEATPASSVVVRASTCVFGVMGGHSGLKQERSLDKIDL